MTRSSLRPITSVGLVAAILTYVGCDKTSKLDKNAPNLGSSRISVSSEDLKSKEPAPTDGKELTPKFIVDWSAMPPAGILIISGEQNGYPDPCGCTAGQLGGLGRRYDLLDKIAAKKWPMAKVDLGNLIRYRADSRAGAKQERIKFDIIFEALGMMKYDAMALGPEDLKLSADELVGMLMNSQPPKFPVVLAANLKFADKELSSTISSIKLTQAGPISIGITAVLADEEVQLNGAGLFEVKPADESIPGLLDELSRNKVQVKILMVQGPHSEAKRLAEKFPGFDIVVGTSEFDDPDERPESVNDGKTLVVDNLGKKGKYAGVVGFFPGSTPMIRFERQALDQAHFHQAEPMRLWIDQEYQDRLKREKVVANFPRIANSAYPAGANYIGAESCQECHPKTFAKWTTTKHAKAYEPLTNPKRNREHDAECISCHTTGFGYKSGWVSAERTTFLKGNQCENCHGPASLHAADPDNKAYREPMHLTAEMVDKNNFCTKCHDSDNDPHFNFTTYYAQIFHKGLDVYTDPKVHQGRPAKVDVK